MTPDESHAGSRRWPMFTLAGLCAAILIWNGYRASTLSITHDEAFTYLWYVAKGPRGIYSSTGYLANNHFLYSLLAWCSVQLFGLSEWALRLPSVLAGVLLVPLAWRLFRRLTGSSVLALTGVLVLVLNPLVMDFSTAARGYSLALALSLWAWRHLCDALDPQAQTDAPAEERRHLLSAGVGMGLAVAANLAFLLPHLALALTFLILKVVRERAHFQRTVVRLWFFWIVPGAALTVGFCYPVFRHLRGQHFYFGSASLFECALSIVQPAMQAAPERNWLCPTSDTALEILTVGLLGVILAVLAPLPFVLRSLVSRSGAWQDAWNTRYALIGGGTMGLIGLHVLLHYLNGTPYPRDRTGLYFLPLVIACGLLVVRKAQDAPGWLAGTCRLLPGLGWLLTAHFITQLQADFLYPWRYDAGTKRIYQELSARAVNHQPPMRIGQSWLFEPAIDFYRELDGCATWSPGVLGRCDEEFDLYFIDAATARQWVMQGKLHIVYDDPVSRAVIGMPVAGKTASLPRERGE